MRLTIAAPAFAILDRYAATERKELGVAFVEMFHAWRSAGEPLLEVSAYSRVVAGAAVDFRAPALVEWFDRNFLQARN
jgi:hypothetical protein